MEWFLKLLKPKKRFTMKVDSDIWDWEEHHLDTGVLGAKELLSSSVTISFSRKTLLNEVRNKEWKSSDRNFISEHRLKRMGERRKLYVCLWGGVTMEFRNNQCILIIFHFLFVDVNSKINYCIIY